MFVELPIDDPYKAELAAAEWARRLGFPDAHADARPGSDGGVDVTGSECLGQVKHYSDPVRNHHLHALYGIAAKEGLTPLFFSLSGYTNPAQEWAESAGMELYKYTIHGELFPVTTSAHQRTASAEFPLELYAKPPDLDSGNERIGRRSKGNAFSISDNKLRQELTDILKSKVTEDNRRELRLRAQAAVGCAERPLPEIDSLASRGAFREIALASRYCSTSILASTSREIGTASIALRVAVASNTSTPASALAHMLASDPSEKVRRRAAMNRSLPPETAFIVLNDEPSSQVRLAYAARKDIPASMRLEPRKFEAAMSSLPLVSRNLQGFKRPDAREKADIQSPAIPTTQRIGRLVRVLGRIIEWIAYVFVGLVALGGMFNQDWGAVIIFVLLALGTIFVIKKILRSACDALL